MVVTRHRGRYEENRHIIVNDVHDNDEQENVLKYEDDNKDRVDGQDKKQCNLIIK